jgi:hypothetical protein
LFRAGIILKMRGCWTLDSINLDADDVNEAETSSFRRTVMSIYHVKLPHADPTDVVSNALAMKGVNREGG